MIWLASSCKWKSWRNHIKGGRKVEIDDLKMAKSGTWAELLVYDATKNGIYKIPDPWKRNQSQTLETKKTQGPDLNLLLPGGTSDLKMDSLRLNWLMMQLILSAKMWTLELRWKPENFRWSQEKEGNDQAQMICQKCCGHSWCKLPWWRKLAYSGDSVLGISEENPLYWYFRQQRLNFLLWCRIFTGPYIKDVLERHLRLSVSVVR